MKSIISRTSITTYTARSRADTGFFGSLCIMFRNVVSYRELIFRMFLRDFSAGYRKSFLGVTWVLLSPLLAAATWVFMNYMGVLRPGTTAIPYPAYLLLSTSIWGLFMGFYQAASGTLDAGKGFIFQVHYPHEALLMKQVLEQISNFTIGFSVNLIVLMGFGVFPSWKIIFMPIIALPLFFLGAGIGVITSVINVVGQEGKRLIDYGLGILLYLTPVIYSRQVENPVLATVIRWNPLTYLISAVRDEIISGHIDAFRTFLVVSLISFLFFILSLRFFFLAESNVIEKIL